MLAIGLTAGALFFASRALPVKACTELYVGKDVSATGQTIYGRTEDGGYNNLKLYDVKKAGAIKAGTTFTDAQGLTYTWGPKDSFRYTSIRDGNKLWDGSSETCYEAQGTNQFGVTISATESLYDNSAIVGNKDNNIAGIDPYKDSEKTGEQGIGEQSLTTIVLGQAENARQGVDIVCEAVDKYGSSEGSGIIIEDGKEAWYIEIVSGTQYAAYKLPTDKCFVNPNVTIMKNVNTVGAANRASATTTDFVVSPNLIDIARKAGTYTDINGKTGENADGTTIDLNKSYSDLNDSVRMKNALTYLNPSLGVTEKNDSFVFTFTPSHKLTLNEVKNFFRLDAIERRSTMECTIFQRYNDLPLELSVVEWRAMVAPKYSVFVPFYPMLINETPEAYRIKTAFDDKAGNYTYDPKSAYFAFQGVKEKCYADAEFAKKAMENYANVEKYINGQFAEDQKTLYAKYSADAKDARAYATELGKKYSDVAINAANALYDGKEVTVPAVTKATIDVTVPDGSKVSIKSIGDIQDVSIMADVQASLETIASDFNKAGYSVLPDTFKIFDLQAEGSGKVKIAMGKDYAGKIAVVGHFHDGKWTVQQCKVDNDGNIYPEFTSFSPVFVEMTTADKEVLLSTASETVSTQNKAGQTSQVNKVSQGNQSDAAVKKSPKTGDLPYGGVLFIIVAAAFGFAYARKHA
jgi:dipeptidase